jgi:hypothetical protein
MPSEDSVHSVEELLGDNIIIRQPSHLPCDCQGIGPSDDRTLSVGLCDMRLHGASGEVMRCPQALFRSSYNFISQQSCRLIAGDRVVGHAMEGEGRERASWGRVELAP